MQMRLVHAVAMVTVFLAAPSPTRAQALPIPGVDAARDVPGAKEVPDAATDTRYCSTPRGRPRR